MKKTIKIGYIQCHEKESKEQITKILNNELHNRYPIQIENYNDYKVLFDIVTSRSEEEIIKIYVATINSIGNTPNDIISNLSKIKETKEISLFFVSEEIDTSIVKIECIIKLLENFQLPIKTSAGRPLGSLKKYDLFCNYYPQMRSISKISREIGVTRTTVYSYKIKWEKEHRIIK